MIQIRKKLKLTLSFGLIFAIALLVELSAKAESMTAIVASIDGTAQLLDQNIGDGQKTLSYEGKKYYFSKVKVGTKIASGQGVMTASDGKVKVIYQHGDVVIVGPSSSLFVPILGGKVASKNEINLLYGRVRAVIDRDGPLSGVKIKTPSAVAGVRGTDLYVSYNQAEQSTEVQVLRGEVDVKPEIQKVIETSKPTTVPSSGLPAKLVQPVNTTPESTSFSVKAGEKVEVEMNHATKLAANNDDVTPFKSAVEKSTKLDIARIQDNTILSAQPESGTAEVKKEVAQAEQKAVENIIRDIKRYDPEASAAIQKQKLASVDLVNIAATEKVQAAASEPLNVVKDVSAPPFVYDGNKYGISISGISTKADCGNYGNNGNNNCYSNSSSGGQIGVVFRRHKTAKFIIQYGAYIDDRNISMTQSGCFGGPCGQYTTTGTQIFAEASILASYNFGTNFAVEGGMLFGLSAGQLTWVNNGNSSGNFGGDMSNLFTPLQLGIRYSFSKTFDAEFVIESSSGIIGDSKIAGFRGNSSIIRANYFFF